MTKNSKLLSLLLFLVLLIACNDKPETISLEQVKYNTNTTSYPTAKMDSAKVNNSITKQKTREVLELSILYNNGNKDSEIDEAIYSQIMGYFFKPDSTTLNNIFVELDSLKVSNAKINRFQVEEKYFKKDTLNFAKFDVEYFDNQSRSIGTFSREAQYILLPAEINYKKEFRFYFLNFYNKPLNDSILSVSTR